MEDLLKEKLEALSAAIRCGRIHTVLVVGLGDQTTEFYMGSNVDMQKMSAVDIANLNFRAIGALHMLMNEVLSGNYVEETDQAVVSSFKVIDDDE